MNKKELIRIAATQSGFSQAETSKVLNSILTVIKNSLHTGENVTLIGFGSFSVLHRRARRAINPSTKQPMTIPAQTTIRFRESKKQG